jgi:peroxiredoxin
MAATSTQITLDTPAPDFRLPATDGRVYTLADVAGDNGTVIAFICNHCPYVLAVIDRLVADARTLKLEGVGFACICSNDAEAYPDDSFDKMKQFAKAHGFPFPYLHDETQQAAKAYGAVCTPDFFGYDRARELKYRGRLDEGRATSPPAGARRELLEAMRSIAATGQAPLEQVPSIGCSIKWKEPRGG